MRNVKLGIRWTIGDVSAQGFEALRLSVWGAWRLFGDRADYAICLNSLPLALAKERTGFLPARVAWHEVGAADLPHALMSHLDEGMAEGVAWKFAPLRIFLDRPEIALDNDCILWDLPSAMDEWIESGDPELCLLAEDVRSCFGQFAPYCGQGPRNLGIRGLPAGYDLDAALVSMLSLVPVRLSSELDEQGLQVAAMSRKRAPLAVSVQDVTICSPFPPHLPHLGRCGAHFVGLNAHDLPWSVDGRGASEHTRENWERLKPEIYRRVGVPVRR